MPGKDATGQTFATGGCLCGAVRFTLRGPLRPVTICHCIMCRRANTALGAYTACAPDRLDVAGRKLRWYRSSPVARRGFCATCGSQLFWEPGHGRHVSVSAGALDDPTVLTPGEHIFTDGTALLRPDLDTTEIPTGARPDGIFDPG